MRRIGLLLLTALMGILFGCETPSTVNPSVGPFVGARYLASTDGEKPVFSLVLAEGKNGGPAIKNGTVTLDGQAVVSSGFGSYWLVPAPDLVAGEVHILKINAPGYSPLTVSFSVPEGAAPEFSISPQPPAYPQKRDTKEAVSYSVSAVGGTWPISGVRVLMKAYDTSHFRTETLAVTASGQNPCLGSFAAGHGVWVGFEARKHEKVSIPGASSDSFLSCDGGLVAKTGFNPLTDLAPYTLEMRVETRDSMPGMDVNASVRDNDYLTGAEFTLDGVKVPELSVKGSYYLSVPTTWSAGSTHTYTIKDLSGKVLTGNLTMPPGALTGAASSPGKGTLAESYTVTPPVGGWPEGSFVECRGIVAGVPTWTTRQPTGGDPAVFNDAFIGKASSITFTTAYMFITPIEGYLTGSQISVTGPLTQW